MRVLVVASLLAVAACSGPGGTEPGTTAHPSDVAQPWGREPYTRTSEIEIDGKLVGYLVEYQPIPAAVDVERRFPTGSYRIQGLDFDDVGFITPRGAVYRHVQGGSTSLGSWPLEEGLRAFYGGGARIRLVPLAPAPPRKPAAPAAEPKEGSEGEKPADEGSEDSGGTSGG